MFANFTLAKKFAESASAWSIFSHLQKVSQDPSTPIRIH